MTDDALDPRDELASAHLDGETAPDEAAAVAADAELADRVAAFATAREAIRAADGPTDEARREAAIAAALAAFDASDAAVTPLTTRRRSPAPRWLPLVGVAAAALVAALLVPLLTEDDGGGDSVALDATTTLADPLAADDSAGAARSEDAELGAGSGAAPHEMAALAPTETVDLGEHADVASLTAAVRERLASGSTTVSGTPPVTPPEAETCLFGLRQAAADAGGATLLQVVAVVDGQPVAATVTQRSDGPQVLDVLALDGCAPVASVQL